MGLNIERGWKHIVFAYFEGPMTCKNCDYTEHAEADSSLFEPKPQKQIHAFDEMLLLASQVK